MAKLLINGTKQTFDTPSDMPLLWVLRDVLGLTGTSCSVAPCGAHVDGKPARSCVLPVGTLQNRAITTIEGISATAAGAKVQKAWLDLEVGGYCQSGQVMSVVALLTATPTLTIPTSTPRWQEIFAGVAEMGARMILKFWQRGSWRLHSDKAREAGEFVDQFAVAVGPALR